MPETTLEEFLAAEKDEELEEKPQKGENSLISSQQTMKKAKDAGDLI